VRLFARDAALLIIRHRFTLVEGGFKCLPFPAIVRIDRVGLRGDAAAGRNRGDQLVQSRLKLKVSVRGSLRHCGLLREKAGGLCR
jgi:hypothetical protein